MAVAKPTLKPFSKDMLDKRANVYVLITPNVAAELMTLNTNNRKIKNRKISNYARDMRAEKWNADASDIKFDTYGQLLDGQNRLLACIEADVPFPTLVRTGLDPAARDHVDTGAARTTADAFRMHEVPDANVTAAAISLWNRYNIAVDEQRGIFNTYNVPAMTHQEALDFLAEHPSIEKMAGAARGVHSIAPGITRSVWYTFTGITGEANEPAARKFATMLMTGEVTGTGDPLLALTRYLALAQSPKMLANRDRAAAMRHFTAALKAWNAWRADEKLEKITVREDEVPPEVAK